MKARLRLEIALAAILGIVAGVTAFWPDWIEIVFGQEPDLGRGQAEWAIIGLLSVLACAAVLLARREHGVILRRGAQATR